MPQALPPWLGFSTQHRLHSDVGANEGQFSQSYDVRFGSYTLPRYSTTLEYLALGDTHFYSAYRVDRFWARITASIRLSLQHGLHTYGLPAVWLAWVQVDK